ncbi:hypothetical protein JCM16303_004531 [Sporobolomyces ruberrimus]
MSRSSTPKLNTSKQPPQGPTRSNASSPAPTQAPLPDLSTLINLSLSITTTTPRTLTGTLYTYDPITSFIVLSTPSTPSSNAPQSFSSPHTYHLVKTSQISSVSILPSTSPSSLYPPLSTPLPLGPSPTLSSLSQRVQSSVATHSQALARLGPTSTTTPEIQAVYDALSKTLPVRWTEKGEIVVLDEVVVDTVNWGIKGGKGSKDRIERVGKVLEGIRAKLAANGGRGTPTIG